jgi:hypothetical protein
MRTLKQRALKGLFFSLAAFFSLPAAAQTPAPAFGVSKETVFWTTFWIMTAILIFAFGFVTLGLLRSRDWQLGDAVSEEAGNQPNPLPLGVKPIMVASASRLIALIGLLNILGVFLGFGYYFLYTAFAGGIGKTETDAMKGVVYYLFSGAVMFAPYLANQLQTAFSSFAAAPQAAASSIPAAAAAAMPTQSVAAPAVAALVRGVAVG